MKKLKILLGNNTLSFLGGSETWTLTLAIQLKDMGHEVVCFSPELGVISDKLEKEGIKCYSDLRDTGGPSPFSIVLEEKIVHNYDVIIANHNHIVSYLRGVFPKTPIISTIHGIIHKMSDGTIAPEHPALESGVSQFVAVSEEIQELLKKEYNIDAPVIRNCFDLKKFDFRPANPTPKQFLINTNYLGKDSPEVLTIKEAAKHFGAKVTAVGMNFSPTLDISKAIEDSDVVFGMGRSVLEGVAGGRLGIVQGRWGSGGVINKKNLDQIRFFNFSGRNSGGVYYSPEELIKEIEENYNPETLAWGRDYIKSDHNAILVAEEYVRMARELTGELILKPSEVVDTRRPFKRQQNV